MTAIGALRNSTKSNELYQGKLNLGNMKAMGAGKEGILIPMFYQSPSKHIGNASKGYCYLYHN